MARDAVAAKAFRGQVRPDVLRLAGKAFSVDIGGLLLIGPRGGIDATGRMLRTLAPLAAGGRHSVAGLMAAGAWEDEAAMRVALAGLGGKLAAVGLRICSRKGGLRMAKLKPDWSGHRPIETAL